MEFKQPQPGKFDVSKSYQLPLEGLKINEFKFVTIKDRILVSMSMFVRN